MASVLLHTNEKGVVSDLPPVCMKCGAQAVSHPMTRFSWAPQWIGWILGLTIVAGMIFLGNFYWLFRQFAGRRLDACDRAQVHFELSQNAYSFSRLKIHHHGEYHPDRNPEQQPTAQSQHEQSAKSANRIRQESLYCRQAPVKQGKQNHRYYKNRAGNPNGSFPELPSVHPGGPFPIKQFHPGQGQYRLKSAVRALDFFADILLLEFEMARAIGANAFDEHRLFFFPSAMQCGPWERLLSTPL